VDQVINISNQHIERVDSFVYLGSSLSVTNDETIKIRRRLLPAKRAYFSVLHLIKSRTIHRRNKITVYKTIIRPVLCYGCEAWTMTSKSKEMLDAFERKILRRICGPKRVQGGWRMRYNTQIYDLYKEFNVSVFIKLRRLQWAGSMIRMNDERIPKKALQQTVYGKRAAGKPRKRWEDC
jgi:hypothetical protein